MPKSTAVAPVKLVPVMVTDGAARRSDRGWATTGDAVGGGDEGELVGRPRWREVPPAW